MANAKTLVSNLAQEVASLLRHDNVDPRIYEWLGLGWNALVQRCPLSCLAQLTNLTISSGTSSVTVSDNLGTPLGVVFRNATAVVCLPAQLTSMDFNRLKASSGSLADATVPLAWTLQNQGTTMKLEILPGASGDIQATILWSGLYSADVPVGTDLFDLPYHWEHVWIWQAAAIGATVLRQPMAPYISREAEDSLQEFLLQMGYAPDATPVLRQVGGVYAGTGRLRRLPQVPDTIS